MPHIKTNNLASALLSERKGIKPDFVKAEPESRSVQINFRVDAAAKRQLEFLRLEIGAKSIQDTLVEAMNDLFEKYGKNRIA
jgi:hypothetical protein